MRRSDEAGTGDSGETDADRQAGSDGSGREAESEGGGRQAGSDGSGRRSKSDAGDAGSSVDPDPDPDPFAALGNETRIGIVDALYECTEPTDPDSGVPYSDLRERAGVDDKGNFNYHLGVLRDRFVTKADGEYRLTFPGFEVAKAMRAGAWVDYPSREPVEVASESPLVGGDPLYASYRGGLVRVHPEGGDPVFQIAVRPAGAADRDVDGLVDVMATLLENAVEQAQRGICPYCHAEPERSVALAETGPWTHRFVADCPECGPLFRVPVGLALVRHPAVVSFYWERGIDLRDRRPWNLDLFGDGAVCGREEDPFRLRVAVERDDGRLAVVLDSDGRVVESTH